MREKLVVAQDGEEIEVEIGADMTAVEINEALRAAGVDVTKVSAVTPGTQLLQRLAQLDDYEQMYMRDEKWSRLAGALQELRCALDSVLDKIK